MHKLNYHFLLGPANDKSATIYIYFEREIERRERGKMLRKNERYFEPRAWENIEPKNFDSTFPFILLRQGKQRIDWLKKEKNNKLLMKQQSQLSFSSWTEWNTRQEARERGSF